MAENENKGATIGHNLHMFTLFQSNPIFVCEQVMAQHWYLVCGCFRVGTDQFLKHFIGMPLQPRSTDFVISFWFGLML